MGEAVRDPTEGIGEVRRCGEVRATSAKDTFGVALGELTRAWSIATQVVTVDSSGSLPIRAVTAGDGAGEGLDRNAQPGMLVRLLGELGGSSIGT